MTRLLLAVALALGPGWARAQDAGPADAPDAPLDPSAPPDPEELPAGAPPPTGAELTPLEQALTEGYADRPEDEPPGSLLGGMLALVPGFFVHGLGHFYTGEEKTALQLLLTEVAAVGLIVGGVVLGNATQDSGEVGGARRALIHAGGFLFVGSWLADVLGALKGAESFPDDSSRVEGSTFSLAYRFTSDPLTPFRHHLVTQLSLDAGLVYVVPQVDLEADLAERTYQVDVGARVWRGRNKHNELAVGARLRRVEMPDFYVATEQYEGYVRWKLDLGQFVRSLRNFYVVNRVGVGRYGALIADDDQLPGFFSGSEYGFPFLVLESGIELNTGPRTHFGLRFIQDPTHDVAPASKESGLLEAGLVHSYSDDLDIEFSLVGGDGWAVWLGTGFGL